MSNVQSYATDFISAGDMSANITGSAFTMINQDGVGIQAVYTGSPVGEMRLQSSNNGTNWDDMAGTAIAVSAAGSSSWTVALFKHRYIRLYYSFTSGTGTLNASINKIDDE